MVDCIEIVAAESPTEIIKAGRKRARVVLKSLAPELDQGNSTKFCKGSAAGQGGGSSRQVCFYGQKKVNGPTIPGAFSKNNHTLERAFRLELWLIEFSAITLWSGCLSSAGLARGRRRGGAALKGRYRKKKGEGSGTKGGSFEGAGARCSLIDPGREKAMGRRPRAGG